MDKDVHRAKIDQPSALVLPTASSASSLASISTNPNPGGLLATQTFFTGPYFPKASSRSYLHKESCFFSGSKKRLDSRAYRCIERQSHLFASSCRPPTYILQSRFQPCITLLPPPDITSSSLQCPSFQLACLLHDLVNPALFPSSISKVKHSSHLHLRSTNIFVT